MLGMASALLVALHGGELHTHESTGMLALLGLAAVVVVGALFIVRRIRSRPRTP